MSARKAAKPAREAAVYAVGDIVLGKVRGYAPWPGMVVDPSSVPQMVTDDRPKSTKTTFYCIRFFPNNDYAWLVEKDISRLKPHEITSFLSSEPDAPSKKKSSNKAGDLAEAYRIAQDPRVWVEETDRKAREALEKQAEEESGDDEEDQLESDASPSAVGKGKKRKRVSDAAGLSTASKKSKKESASTAGKKKGAAAAGAGNASAKGRNGAKKSKAAVESEDDGGHGPSASGAEDTGRAGKEPPAKRPRREDEDEAEGPKDAEASSPENQRVKDWRHKLQKTFLGKVPPKDEDMLDIDALFTTVETTEVGIEGLQYSKIGKVMRHIAALTPAKVPRDAEFKFRERAKALVERWQGVLNAAKVPANGTPAAGSPGKDDADVNAARDTAAAINVSATADADMDAHGEADAPGEVEETEVKGVEEGTAKIDLNGTKPSTIDVQMTDA